MASHAPPQPPRLSLHLATPSLPSASLLPAPPSPSPTTSTSKNSLFDQDWTAIAPPPSKNRSRSSTAESRYSVSSSDGGQSSGTGGRKSWMDMADDSPPLSTSSAGDPLSTSPPSKTRVGWTSLAVDTAVAEGTTPTRTPVPLPDQSGSKEYPWPLTPPSPFSASHPPSSSAFPTSNLPPPVPPVPPLPPSALFSIPSLPPTPISPPRPILPPRQSTLRSPPRSSTASPAAESISSRTSALPPTAGQSSNPLLDTRQSPSLRLSPTPPYLLGEGRHASVYLAAFVPRESAGGAGGTVRVEKRPRRKLCAAKRLFPDRESQVSGLGEAFILAKLAAPSSSSAFSPSASAAASPSTAPVSLPSSPSPAQSPLPARSPPVRSTSTNSLSAASSPAAVGARYILGLYGVRDERDGLDPPLPLPLPSAGPGTPATLSRHGSTGKDGERVKKERWSLGGVTSGTASPKSPLGRSFADQAPTSPIVRIERATAAEEEQEQEGGEPKQQQLHRRQRVSSAHFALSKPPGRRPRHSEPFAASEGGTSSGAGGGGSGGAARLSLLSTALEPPLSSSKSVGRRVSLAGPPPSSRSGASGAQTLPSSPTTSRPSTAPSLPSASVESSSPRVDLLLEFCPFGQVLSFARASPELLGEERWLGWAKELSSAVEWCHARGVLHADLKPQNVLIASDLTLRLSDFGNSLFLPPPSSPPHLFPTDPHGLGTPSYSPPEFVRPLPSPFSYPSDIFSLGVTLSVLLTAREPYTGLRTVERMLTVARGGFWEFEERRRIRELDDADTEEATLSRAGSVRSMRSGRSSRRGSIRGRRDDSVESVRSFVSTPDGGFGMAEGRGVPMEVVARSLLADEPEEGDEEEEEAVEKAVREAFPPLPSLAAASSSAAHSRHSSAASHPLIASASDSPAALPPPTRFYPSTSTPVQYFLSFPPPGIDFDALSTVEQEKEEERHVVPLAVRELLRRMTSPEEGDRPTAREVREEIERIMAEEGVLVEGV
ncbi:hypothetical protein JCM8097_004770 [Rhodosporidiobolus ruineniae]